MQTYLISLLSVKRETVQIHIECGGKNWIYWTVIMRTAVVERDIHRVINEEAI